MLESTLFPIKEIPVMYDVVRTPNGKIHDVKTGYKLIVREDNDKVLSCMTDEYQVVTNKELVDTAVPILEKHKAELKEAVSLADGQKTIYKWIIPGIKIKVAEGDELNPEIIMKNSYDGTLQVHILAGAFRIVCSNGVIIGVKFGQSNFKHSVNNVNLKNLDEQIEKTIDHTSNMAEGFEILSDTEMNERDIFKLVKLFPSQMSEFLVQYLIAHKPKTYWDLLNCGTYLASHRMKRHYQSTHKLESELFHSVSKWAENAARA